MQEIVCVVEGGYAKQQVIIVTSSLPPWQDRKENEKSQKPIEDVNKEKEIKVSKTNPDCEYMIRDAKQYYRCS
jgi:acetoin utilization deacetylase AcuC-like enzyme